MLNKKKAFALSPFTLATSITCIALMAGCNKEAPKRTHYDNPFAEATKWYVNPAWSAKAKADGGSAIANTNTSVWLTHIADVEASEATKPYTPHDGMDLRAHLDEALAQKADLLVLTLYNLPGRGCSSVFGEAGVIYSYPLDVSAEGMTSYKTDYIDKIVALLGEDQYAGVSIVAIVEPDSLTNIPIDGHDDCAELANTSPWGYTEGVRYALTQLATLPNVHSYLDAAYSAKLGWSDYMEASAMFIAGVMVGYDGLDGQALGAILESDDGSTGLFYMLGDIILESAGETPAPGWGAISGFATNIANYIPLAEPYIRAVQPEPNGGQTDLYTDTFYDWNPMIGELEYSQEWLRAVRGYGADDSLGIVIDTSRNGWGGPSRPNPDPDAVYSTIKEQVDALRLDRRPHRRSFCNPEGAGLGERPQANPMPNIDAYVWAKPVGESDGISSADFPIDASFTSRKHEEMCDPNGQNRYAERSDATADLNIETGAMYDAPHYGRWFSQGFKSLLENAYPPIKKE